KLAAVAIAALVPGLVATLISGLIPLAILPWLIAARLVALLVAALALLVTTLALITTSHTLGLLPHAFDAGKLTLEIVRTLRLLVAIGHGLLRLADVLA